MSGATVGKGDRPLAQPRHIRDSTGRKTLTLDFKQKINASLHRQNLQTNERENIHDTRSA